MHFSWKFSAGNGKITQSVVFSKRALKKCDGTQSQPLFIHSHIHFAYRFP